MNNWIKITQYLPGDSRLIQIWNEPKVKSFEEHSNGKFGNYIGYYQQCEGKFIGVVDPDGDHINYIELSHPTHWAEMLSKPDDLT